MNKKVIQKVEKIEEKSQEARSILFRPILFLLTKLNIRANHISFLGLIFSVCMFILLKEGQSLQAMYFFLAYYFADGLDGTLARYQKAFTERGKFVDMTVDNVAGNFLILGLIHIGAIDPVQGALLIYLMLLNLIFSITIYSTYKKTEWFFYARGGILAHTPKNLFFLLFILWALNVINLLNPAIIIFNAYLLLLATINFFRILNFKSTKA